MIVVIDGPAGAGKSTVARRLAERLGATYLDTGAMYRAVAWLALREGVDVDDSRALTGLAEAHPVVIEADPGSLRVRVAGVDVADHIRDRRVSEAASRVAVVAGVRRAMVAAQQRIMADGDWVADGRDLGTVVCPGADLKIFLTASVDERARRRHGDGADGIELERVRAEVIERDRRDTERVEGPLRAAEDARLIDSSDLDADAVVERILAMIATG